ncbi:hypothetical protein FO519_010361, partial [Halicephalobus sp. NKZ332]
FVPESPVSGDRDQRKSSHTEAFGDEGQSWDPEHREESDVHKQEVLPESPASSIKHSEEFVHSEEHHFAPEDISESGRHFEEVDLQKGEREESPEDFEHVLAETGQSPVEEPLLRKESEDRGSDSSFVDHGEQFEAEPPSYDSPQRGRESMGEIREEYDLVEGGDVPTTTEHESHLSFEEKPEHEYQVVESTDVHYSDTEKVQTPPIGESMDIPEREIDLMTQSVHPDYFNQGEDEADDFELVQTDDIPKDEEKVFDTEFEHPKSPEEGEWQKVSPESESAPTSEEKETGEAPTDIIETTAHPLQKTSEFFEEPLERRPADVPYPSGETQEEYGYE